MIEEIQAATPKRGFRDYFDAVSFSDRFEREPAKSVDVIIPVLHTNELWRANLLSAYREIPINRLLLGDGGCIDDTIEIAREFPRVHVYDHTRFASLGYSIRRLIEAVETEWFVYLHSDVYLPEGWFEAMCAAQARYDWFESGQYQIVMVKHLQRSSEAERAYSGSQMGRKAAFATVLPQIDDDYLYRNEEIIFSTLIKDAGFRYGKVRDIFCEHQLMFKDSPWLRRVKWVRIELELSRAEEVRAALTYVKGIVKYLKPEMAKDLVTGLHENLERLQELEVLDPDEFARWVAVTNPAWSSVFPVQLPVAGIAPAARVSTDAAARVSTEAGSVERLDRYQATRLARVPIYLLTAIDLTLRGLVGPGRALRRRMASAWGDDKREVYETRPTRAVIKTIKYVDQVASRKRSLRHLKRDVKWVAFIGFRKMARGLDLAAAWFEPKG